MATLTCPVCSASIPSLQQLNDHLDNAHAMGSEDGQDDQEPQIMDKTNAFNSIRKRHIEKLTINRTRLELRLVKLLTGLQKFTDSERGESALWNWRDISSIRKFEMQVVNWEDESVFERCRFCGQKFSFFVRKHHCRICGLVTCGDVERECSLEVPAMLLAKKLTDLDDGLDLSSVNTDFPIRICTECRSVLFSHRNYCADIRSEPPRLLRMHYQLEKIQNKVVSLLPEFEETLLGLKKNAAADNISRVRHSRQKLLQLFSQYDSLTRKIRGVSAETETETRMRNQILAKAAVFLETTMLPLQSLPQALRYNEPQLHNKVEAADLQNKLVVLEEQRFLLEQQVDAAKRNRQFDALAPMEVSLAEIASEISTLTDKLGQYAPTT